MEQGLIITAWGMGIVFTVLAIMYFSIVVLGWYEQKFPTVETAQPKRIIKTNNTSLNYTDDEVAAIKGALAMHLKKKPEDFDIKVKIQ